MKVDEIGIFVDNICLNKELALPEITVQPTATTGKIETKVHGKKIAYGTIFYTADEQIISPPLNNPQGPKNNWVIDELKCDANGNFSFAVPKDAKWYFVTVVDEDGNRSSTQLIKVGE